jgi:hypothetical protein
MPAVKGAFLHSLAGTYGPWPLFHRVQNELSPSVIYWALLILRQSMLDDVLNTVSTSTRHSAYRGEYDMRATVMANRDRTQFSIWVVNHQPENVTVQFNLPGLTSGGLDITHTYLSDTNPMVNNRADSHAIRPVKKILFNESDKYNGFNLSLPPNSVNTFVIRNSGT